MIEVRPIKEEDKPNLQAAIDNSKFHPGEWQVDHFFNGGYSVVAEDQLGPILFVKYTKVLRISIVWNDEQDKSRNAKALIVGLKDTVEKARANGYTELIFTTNVPELAKFCEQVLGYRKSGDEYILPLEGN